MTTFNDLIVKTMRRLQPLGVTETLTLLNGISAGATSLTVFDPAGNILPSLQAGMKIAVDLEVFYVQAVSSTTVTVVPGYDGSTEASHSAGTLVYVNPRFTAFDVGTAINDDLLDLSSPFNGLFQLKSLEITYNPSITGYDLTDVNGGGAVSSINEIISIRYKVPYPIGMWKPIPYGAWELTPASDTTAFPSGYALSIYRGGYPGLPMRVTYAAPFGQLVNPTDDVTAVAGLPATAVPLPPLGAMVSLVAPREVKRNETDAEPDARRAPEVPPGAVMNSVAGVLRERQARINAESARLQQLVSQQRTAV